MKKIKTKSPNLRKSLIKLTKQCRSCGVYYGTRHGSIASFFHDQGSKWHDSCKKCVNQYGESLIHWTSRSCWRIREVVLISDQKGEGRFFLTEQQCEEIMKLEKEREEK